MTGAWARLKGRGTNVSAVLPETVDAGPHVVQVMTARGGATREVLLLGIGDSAPDPTPGDTTVRATTVFD